MRRRGDQPGERPGNPLADLKQEVLGTLKLLFRDIEQYSINCALPDNLTVYCTDIRPTVVEIPLDAPAPQVSGDPIQSLRQETETILAPLLTEAKLSESSPCHFESVACHEPVFDEMDFEAVGVSFQNLTDGKSWAWEIDPVQTRPTATDIGQIARPNARQVLVESLNTQNFSFSDQLPKIRTMHTPRFYALPIRKSPIPPHRFPPELRERFRLALAEKAGVSQGKVQLKIVFEPMDMALYASIQQDEQGNLLCTPKNEVLGRNQALMKQVPGAGGTAYLVYGFRLDNKQDIRALVPVSALREEKT